MATNSVGSLFIDIQARTAKLEVDMGKVRGILAGLGFGQVGNDATKAGEKMSTAMQRGVLGAMLLRQAIRSIISEIGYVMENIEKIHGVNPEVLSNIIEMRDNIAEWRNELDLAIASVMNFMAQWGKMIGVSWANVIGGFTGHPTGDIPLVNGTPDEEARAKDKSYDDKLEAARLKLGEVTKELRDKTIDLAGAVEQLRKEQELETKFQGNANLTTLAILQSKIRVLQEELKIKTNLETLNKKLQGAEDRNEMVVQAGRTKTLPLFTQIQTYRAQVKALQEEINNTPLYRVMAGGHKMEEDPAAAKKLIRLTEEKTVAQLKLNEAMKKYGDLATEMGESMAHDLITGIENGEKMHQIFLKLIQDVIKLIIQQEIEKPLAAMFSGGISALGGWMMSAMSGMATGGPYVANQPFIAGENGPELIIPSSSGTVANAQQTANMGGKDDGGMNITIHQTFGSGVTQAQLAGMIPMITQQAKGAVLDAVRRGGAYRYAFNNGM